MNIPSSMDVVIYKIANRRDGLRLLWPSLIKFASAVRY